MNSCKLKLVPYGDGDFVSIRNGGYAYVDKTSFIESLEQGGVKHPFIVRPRRFGKTLFTSMLKAYYDVASSDRFEELFKGTYIAEHKTASAGKFRVLRLDFSGISSQNVMLGFCKKLQKCCSEFARRYPSKELKACLSCNELDPVNFITDFFAAAGYGYDEKLYVIIDEYDQFANELLSEDVEEFKKITSKNGFLKQFYAALKSESVDGIVAHVFITGVTSISLDSMSSGFNIRKDISSLPEYADMFGFNESELKELIPQVIDLEKYRRNVDEIYERMKVLYDGYRFTPVQTNGVFNPSMSLYYLGAIKDTNAEPRQLLDPAFSPDLSKVKGILSLGESAFAKAVVEQALKHQPISFGVPSTVINLNSVNMLSQKDVLTAMLCMGFLTYSCEKENALTVPNYAVLQQFFGYYLSFLSGGVDTQEVATEDFKVAFAMLKKGELTPLLKELCRGFACSSGIHKDLHLKESDFQTLLQGVMFFCSDYETYAEVEVNGRKRGYADLVLKAKNSDDVSYIIELKYTTHKAGNNSQDMLLNHAWHQVQEYASDKILCKIPNLKCAALVFTGTGKFALKCEEPQTLV